MEFLVYLNKATPTFYETLELMDAKTSEIALKTWLIVLTNLISNFFKVKHAPTL